MNTKAYAAFNETDALGPHTIERRTLSPKDVFIDIDYCGVCHSDIHTVKGDWGKPNYPVVPGHEIIGRVKEIGSEVTKFKVGDLVGVGCMVESCQHCHPCDEGLEQYCESGSTGTYNSKNSKHGGITYGGYSENIVVEENFVLHVPENIDVKAAAPLLCAGITTWSPLRHWNVKAGDKVGVVGLGGLGHMGVKFAKAMGAHVVMITTSESKGEDAKKLGADEVLISKDADQMKAQRNTFDFLLNTIPVKHDVNPYLALLKLDKTMCMVGAIEPLDAIHGGLLILKRRNLTGSLIGGIKETQEMLDFCGEHNIVSDVEMIDIQNINTAYERMMKSDVKYRFVIDIKSLKNS
ncbi:NAD(P)-dependent alcohol dehydrogenase [Empedobacter stercoris]|uniref:NAD(P)-dependent alcohol dehydrogenase n=1 Tax=Empedobacter stercoris TaxID=1628248 RepID=A0ABX1WPS3_9FLAO|nr:NAD(P)-dependent alcohol dehydrogenase [Empedobacter stercoris]MCA4782727.1 NAD(P)-dependent alcohol dehydrogenase [Empedobacter stercoris]MCA4810649.1 NAD(P)-dependent alcohol dehydrogenase [Empedobacter stercoris]NOJ76685.1 NAD(P)-dependent alcohol dehydrogenase [Empedobacter stercoris]QNT15188.1 NAD(P)-dependent alcohol dehydrogenase [Empedobacter stercoris]